MPLNAKTIAVVSDIHGNFPALEEVAADIRRRHVDAVVNLGDHLSGPLWPGETARFLMSQDWIQISGNHDRQLISQNPGAHGPSDRYAFNLLYEPEREWLRSLPASFRIDESVFLFHGTPFNDSEYLLETIEHGRTRLASRNEIRERLGTARSSVMLCGHTHVQRVVELGDSTMIINPGSVGLPAYEDDSPEPHVVETGSPHARYAILKHDGGWTVESIMVPYDFQKAAERALKNNRPDWVTALQTGFMRL